MDTVNIPQLKSSFWYFGKDVNEFLMDFNVIYCFFWIIGRYWNEVHTKHGNLFVSLQSEQKQGRE